MPQWERGPVPKPYPLHNLRDDELFTSISRKKKMNPRLAVFLITSCAWTLGCGNSNRPKTIPVSGVVTFDGQPPEHPGGLFFAPLEVEEGYPKRGGRALFEADGAFAATSFEDGDGLIPGTYKVRIESWKQPPSMGTPGISNIPKGFEPSDLVVSSKENAVEYDLDIRKTKK